MKGIARTCWFGTWPLPAILCQIRCVSLPFNSDHQDYHGTNWFSANQLEHIELSWSIYSCLTFLFAFGGIWTCSLRGYPKQPQLYLWLLKKSPVIYYPVIIPYLKTQWFILIPNKYPKQPRFALFFISSFRYAKYLSLESSGSSFWSTKNNFLGVLPWKLSVHSRRDLSVNTVSPSGGTTEDWRDVGVTSLYKKIHDSRYGSPTVDGWNPKANAPGCMKPCKYDIYHINWLAGCFPSTVSIIKGSTSRCLEVKKTYEHRAKWNNISPTWISLK